MAAEQEIVQAANLELRHKIDQRTEEKEPDGMIYGSHVDERFHEYECDDIEH